MQITAKIYLGGKEIDIPVEIPLAPEGISFLDNLPIITWIPDDSVVKMLATHKLGKHLTLDKGVVETDEAKGQYVKFIVSKKEVKVITSTRPDLKILADYAHNVDLAISEARKILWEQEREMTDGIPLKMMAEQEAILRSQIPVGAVEVEAKEIQEDIIKFFAEGIELPWEKVIKVGWASATRKGAMAPFASKMIVYILPDVLKTEIDLQQAKANEKAEKKAAIEAARKAKFDEAKATGKPVVLRTWMTDGCSKNLPDCSFDQASELAMPNGSTKIEYIHCH